MTINSEPGSAEMKSSEMMILDMIRNYLDKKLWFTNTLLGVIIAQYQNMFVFLGTMYSNTLLL